MAEIPPASPTNSPSMPHNLTFSIVNLRNNPTLKMPVRGVDSIFHAVALKQVPSCGFLPMEAVKTNVMGMANALDANCRWSPIQSDVSFQKAIWIDSFNID